MYVTASTYLEDEPLAKLKGDLEVQELVAVRIKGLPHVTFDANTAVHELFVKGRDRHLVVRIEALEGVIVEDEVFFRIRRLSRVIHVVPVQTAKGMQESSGRQQAREEKRTQGDGRDGRHNEALTTPEPPGPGGTGDCRRPWT